MMFVDRCWCQEWFYVVFCHRIINYCSKFCMFNLIPFSIWSLGDQWFIGLLNGLKAKSFAGNPKIWSERPWFSAECPLSQPILFGWIIENNVTKSRVTRPFDFAVFLQKSRGNALCNFMCHSMNPAEIIVGLPVPGWWESPLSTRSGESEPTSSTNRRFEQCSWVYKDSSPHRPWRGSVLGCERLPLK